MRHNGQIKRACKNWYVSRNIHSLKEKQGMLAYMVDIKINISVKMNDKPTDSLFRMHYAKELENFYTLLLRI